MYRGFVKFKLKYNIYVVIIYIVLFSSCNGFRYVLKFGRIGGRGSVREENFII